MSDEAADGERWELYPCWIGEDYGLVRVELSMHDRAPEASRPHSVRVSMPLLAPNDVGMPVGEEYEHMTAFEEAFVAAVPEAVLVGATIAGGVRHWYLYSGTPDEHAAAIRAVGSAVAPEHAIEVGSFEDPAWEQYLGFLYPNALAWQYIQDQQLLRHMQTMGDDGSVPRIISHWAYFPSRGARRVFIKGIKELDYAVQKKITGEKDDDERFGVHFDTLYEQAPASVTQHTERLVALALESEGRYDGWEVPVVKADAGEAG